MIGPVLIVGEESFEHDTMYYFCAAGETVSESQVFSYFKDAKVLRSIKLESKKSHIEQLEEVKNLISRVESEGTQGLDIEYLIKK